MKEQKKGKRIDFYEKRYIDFIKALGKKDLNLSVLKAEQLRQYDCGAHNAVKVLEDWITINGQKKKVDKQIHDLKIHIKQIELQNTRLAFQKTPDLNKKQQQVCSIVQSVDLMAKKKYLKAYNHTLSSSIRDMSKDLWEYDCLKKQSDKFRKQVQPFQEPAFRSTQYAHIKEVITAKNNDVEKIHIQYAEALRRVFQFNADEKQFKLITKENIMLIKAIENRLKNFQFKARNHYEEIDVLEDKNSQQSQDFQVLEAEVEKSKQSRKSMPEIRNKQIQFQSNFDQQWKKLNDIRTLLDKAMGKVRTVDCNNFSLSVDSVLDDVTNFLKSQSQIPKQKITLTQTQPVTQIRREFLQREIIVESLNQRIKQLQNRQKQVRLKVIQVHKTVLQMPLIQSDPIWIEQTTQIDEIIDNTIKNAKVLVEEFNNIKNELVQVQNKVDSMNIQKESQKLMGKGYIHSQILEQKQEKYEGQDLVTLQDYIQKIQLLEQINSNLAKQKENFMQKIQKQEQLKKQLENKEKIIEDYCTQISDLKLEISNMKQNMSKQINKLKSIEKSGFMNRSMSFQENSVMKNTKYPSFFKTESVILQGENALDEKTFDFPLKGPPKLSLETSMAMEESHQKSRIIEELKDEISILKKQNRVAIQKLEKTIQNYTRQNIALQNKLNLFESQITELRSKKIELKQKIQQLNIQLMNVIQKKNEIQLELNEKMDIINHQQIQSTLLKSNKLEQNQGSVKSEQIHLKKSSAHIQLTSLRQQYLYQKSKNQKLISDIKSNEEKTNSLVREIEQKQKKYDQISQKNKVLNNQVIQLKEELKFTQNKKKQEKDIKDAKIQQLENDITNLKTKLSQRQLKQKQKELLLSQQNNQITRLTDQLQNQKENIYSQQQQQAFAVSDAHLFTAGDLFDDGYHSERLNLINKLEKQLGKIKRTKLLYKYDQYNKVNFHKYIDHHKHIVIIFKTIYGKCAAAYSEEAFNSKGIKKGPGLMMPLWSQEIYRVHKNSKALTYDEYYIIYGNSEIRIKSLETKVFSNFGVKNGFYDCRGHGVMQFLGQSDRQVDILGYELYQLVLQRQAW